MMDAKGGRTRLIRGVLWILLAMIVVAASVILALHFLPFELPAPTGEYPVGRLEFAWIDPDRVDPLSDQPGELRELLVWVWYPAADFEMGSTAPYLPSDWLKTRAGGQGIRRFLEHDYAAIRTHSLEEVPIAEQQGAYPVLVMMPGLGNVPADYTVFAENLASHGYAVVGIHPTYSSNLVVFPDGRAVFRSEKSTLPADADAAGIEAFAGMLAGVWADDAGFVLDMLEAINEDPANVFYGRLDLARIGLFGHSFGGATAAAVCKADPRCRAGADLDGALFDGQKDGVLQVPFMVFTHDECGAGCETLYEVFSTAENAAYYLTVGGSRHDNFGDSPIRWLGPARPIFSQAGSFGPISPERGLEIMNTYLLAFFDGYLREIDSDFLAGQSMIFPEVQFEKHE